MQNLATLPPRFAGNIANMNQTLCSTCLSAAFARRRLSWKKQSSPSPRNFELHTWTTENVCTCVYIQSLQQELRTPHVCTHENHTGTVTVTQTQTMIESSVRENNRDTGSVTQTEAVLETGSHENNTGTPSVTGNSETTSKGKVVGEKRK